MEQYEFPDCADCSRHKTWAHPAVHCTDVLTTHVGCGTSRTKSSGFIEKHGFEYRNRITIWKELPRFMRTMVKSPDAQADCRGLDAVFHGHAGPMLILTKRGENAGPADPCAGLTGTLAPLQSCPTSWAFNDANESRFTGDQLWGVPETPTPIDADPKSNKLSHYIWQRYASSVWDDIRIDNVLPFRDSREEDDEKHVHPLQLDEIDRIVELYSNPGEIVLDPVH